MRALDGGGMGAGIEAADVDGAGVRQAQAERAFDERGLAGAIRAEEAEDFARRDLKGDGIDGADGAVGLYQVADGKAGRGFGGVVHVQV